MTDVTLLPHVALAGYGVLGTQLNAEGKVVQAGPEPGLETAVVDPAGLPFIQVHGPSRARGASGAVYGWLGIKSEAAFPDPVREAIKAPCKAKCHRYDAKCVIHVVGPNLHGVYGLGPEVVETATDRLAAAYGSMLSEFLASGASLLRLLPISGGIFAGRFADDIPWMTFAALDRGFRLLPDEAREELLSRCATTKLEMCIFSEQAMPEYQAALEAGGKPPEGGPKVLGRIWPGALALISGLEAEAAQPFNGTVCTVLALDAEAAKYTVLLNNGGKANLPASNLEVADGGALVPGARATVDGLQSAAGDKYNGTVALLQGWNAPSGKWLVRLTDGQKANLPAANLRLVPPEAPEKEEDFIIDLF